MNRIFVLGLLASGLIGCTTGPIPMRSATPAAPAVATPVFPAAAAPRTPAPGQVITAPPASQAMRDQAAVAAGCRLDADRIVTTRDRGQLMREDERDARVGTDASIYARRGEIDRLGRLYERDRIADECLQQNTRGTPSATSPSVPRGR